MHKIKVNKSLKTFKANSINNKKQHKWPEVAPWRQSACVWKRGLGSAASP